MRHELIQEAAEHLKERLEEIRSRQRKKWGRWRSKDRWAAEVLAGYYLRNEGDDEASDSPGD